MSLSSEKLVNFIIEALEETNKQYNELTETVISPETTAENLDYIRSSMDELRGYKFALEDILEALPDFEQNN